MENSREASEPCHHWVPRAHVIWLIVSSGLKLTGAGIAVGIAGALATTRLPQTMLFGVTLGTH